MRFLFDIPDMAGAGVSAPGFPVEENPDEDIEDALDRDRKESPALDRFGQLRTIAVVDGDKRASQGVLFQEIIPESAKLQYLGAIVAAVDSCSDEAVGVGDTVS